MASEQVKVIRHFYAVDRADGTWVRHFDEATAQRHVEGLKGDWGDPAIGYGYEVRSLEPVKLYTQQEVEEARHVGPVAIGTMALDLTEGIWPRVKGIEQYELIALAEKCIRKGIEMSRPKHGLATPTEER